MTAPLRLPPAPHLLAPSDVDVLLAPYTRPFLAVGEDDRLWVRELPARIGDRWMRFAAAPPETGGVVPAFWGRWYLWLDNGCDPATKLVPDDVLRRAARDELLVVIHVASRQFVTTPRHADFNAPAWWRAAWARRMEIEV